MKYTYILTTLTKTVQYENRRFRRYLVYIKAPRLKATGNAYTSQLLLEVHLSSCNPYLKSSEIQIYNQHFAKTVEWLKCYLNIKYHISYSGGIIHVLNLVDTNKYGCVLTYVKGSLPFGKSYSNWETADQIRNKIRPDGFRALKFTNAWLLF